MNNIIQTIMLVLITMALFMLQGELSSMDANISDIAAAFYR